VQNTTLRELVFSVPELIAYCSSTMRINPGDIIATGSPAGVGAKRKPPLWLKPGDVVEVEVSGVGVLRNTVIDEA
jgi:2-keto-4-pentenoate hydratase/2-oxohepta-3-ene-1,7-dioic acid hydratase in catechol pathway